MGPTRQALGYRGEPLRRRQTRPSRSRSNPHARRRADSTATIGTTAQEASEHRGSRPRRPLSKRVTEKGPADHGLRAGDHLVMINEIKVLGAERSFILETWRNAQKHAHHFVVAAADTNTLTKHSLTDALAFARFRGNKGLESASDSGSDSGAGVCAKAPNGASS